MKRIAAFIATFSLIIVSFGVMPSLVFADAQYSGEALILEVTEPDVIKHLDLVENTHLFDNFYRVILSDSDDLKILYESDEVLSIQQDFRVQNQQNSNDPLFVLDATELSKQWYLPKIQIHKAWDTTRGSANTVVAVIDTGINGKHEDLKDGRVIAGFANYCQVTDPNNDSNCIVRLTGGLGAGVNSDDNGHGTIVAGLIGAVANNGVGITGINWNIKLMPIKVLDSSGSGNASDVAVGIRWAADNGADIINLSVGGPGLQGLQVLQEAVDYAYEKGVLIVAAAGNDAAITGGNLNTNPVSPVCMDGGQNKILGVAATDFNDKKTSFSNYGSSCIDVSAPGAGFFVDRENKQGIVSTYYDPSRPGENDLYVYAAGTSVATPLVTGVAALVLDVFPNFGVDELRNRILSSVDNIDSENQDNCGGSPCGNHIGSGRLNAWKAVSKNIEITNDSLVRNAAGQTYLIERGERRYISEFVLNQRFSGVKVVDDNGQLGLYPEGDPVSPVDGTIIKEPGHPLVYLVEGGERLPLSYAAFASRNLSFDEIEVLPASEVLLYRLGMTAEVLPGLLLKTHNSPAVYLWTGSELRLLSYYVFKQKGYENHFIATLDPDEFNIFAEDLVDFLVSPNDGSLIRGDREATVYLIEAGKRRGLSLSAFNNRGFSFENVQTLPQSEVGLYELSDPLIN